MMRKSISVSVLRFLPATIVVVAAVWTALKQGDLVSQIAFPGFLFVVLFHHISLVINSIGMHSYLSKNKGAIPLREIIFISYRSQLAFFGLPNIIGSGLKLKRLGSRSSPNLVLYYLGLERLLANLIWVLAFGFLILISGYQGFDSQIVVLAAVFAIGTLLLGWFFTANYNLILKWLSKLNGPMFKSGILSSGFNKEWPKPSGHMAIFIYSSSSALLDIAATVILAISISSNNWIQIVFARFAAFIANQIPLPIPQTALREGASLSASLVSGSTLELGLTIVSVFVFGNLSSAIVGLVFEIRALRKQR